MNNRIRTALLAVAVLALAAIPAASQEKEKEAPSLLTPAHKLLGSITGDFETTTRMWMKPDADPVEAKSASKREVLLDGLFLRESYEVKDGQFAHKGEITWAYNTATKKVQYVQLLSNSPAMNIYEGEFDEKAKAFTVRSAYTMTYDGVEYDVKTRIVLSVESADKQKLEIFSAYEFKGGSIPEYREIEVNYTRKK
jgi:lipopolysaccharide export system protein LptC